MKYLENNESLTLCGQCGGECCLTRPGLESPERFISAPEGPAESMHKALSSGWWVLDSHHGLPPGPNGEKQVPAGDLEVLYPRPATAQEREDGKILGSSEAGSCSYLASNRCLLKFEDRPLMCRALEPGAGFECRSGWTRLDAARAWFPWQEVIQSVLARFRNDAVMPKPLASVSSGCSSDEAGGSP